ncbi:MAG: helix-turn-helix domain-containing protein [Candidatus Saccharibacteria bacterium]|nr:helix-turn-helix domain-containing protein [Candidatus Saccharibacteria bacterium]
MNYETFQPSPDLQPFVKLYWLLEVPAEPNPAPQRIVPDGCIELIFNLGDDIEHITDSETITQPRTMLLGHITKSFFIRPTGRVDSFAVRFYPHGFYFLSPTVPLRTLTDTETPLANIINPTKAARLEADIAHASSTPGRIAIIESFLRSELRDNTSHDTLVALAVDTIFATKGRGSIGETITQDQSRRRQLERRFRTTIGMSPKQLSRVARLQAVLRDLLDNPHQPLAQVAQRYNYYDQAHFIKDFKDFTGVTPQELYRNTSLELSSVFYAP